VRRVTPWCQKQLHRGTERHPRHCCLALGHAGECDFRKAAERRRYAPNPTAQGAEEIVFIVRIFTTAHGMPAALYRTQEVAGLDRARGIAQRWLGKWFAVTIVEKGAER